MANPNVMVARLLMDRGEVAQLLDDLVRRLESIERKLDRVLAAVLDKDDVEACPFCGNTGETEEIEDTSVMGEPARKTCHACGRSWSPGGPNGEA